MRTRTDGARPATAWARAAAASGFAAVLAGAFAAHGMTDPRAQELLRTGAAYQLAHAAAALACAALARLGVRRAGWAAGLFVTGSVLFSGSLYALAFGAPRWTGLVTPFGGLAFLAGWAVLAWALGGGRQAVR